MLATHFLLKATAPGANYFAYTFLGFLGEALAITAAILLIIFIVSLFVRPNDQPKKEPKSNLTKRERIALMILSVVLASIGLITLVLNLFG
jgi:amino acid permease